MDAIALQVHSFEVIRELIAQSQEGFHGTLYEMTEGMYEVAPQIFVGEYDAEMDDEDDKDNVVAYASNRQIAEDAFNEVIMGMIAVVTDHVNKVVRNSTQSLRVRSLRRRFALPHEVTTYVLNEMCVAIADAGVPSLIFTREFFERNR